MLVNKKKLLVCISLVVLLSACAEMPKKVGDVQAPSLDKFPLHS